MGDYLEKKKETIDKKIQSSKQLVKDLNKLKSLELEKQEAKVYTGLKGVKTLYDSIIDDLTAGD